MSKLTREELDQIECEMPSMPMQSGFHVADFKVKRLIAHVRAQDEALREIEKAHDENHSEEMNLTEEGDDWTCATCSIARATRMEE